MTIQDLLIAWGRNRALSDPPNGYPTSILGRMMSKGTVSLPTLPDEDVERVDAAVSQLRLKHTIKHEIIKLHYIHHRTDREIAKQMGGSRSWIRSLRENAEHYLEGKLD